MGNICSVVWVKFKVPQNEAILKHNKISKHIHEILYQSWDVMISKTFDFKFIVFQPYNVG